MPDTHAATDTPAVLILAGGLSHERDVSIRSGRRVAAALSDVGCTVTVRDVDANLLDSLALEPPDVVWPLLHGVTGEDGSIRDILEVLDLAYVGSTPQACRLAWDKTVAKSVLREAGLRVPDSVALPHGVFRDLGAQRVLEAIIHRLGLPLVVKPTRGGSSLGVSVVRDPRDFPRAMIDCFAYGDVALVERFVAGSELAISVVDRGEGPFALPAVEIVADNGVYDYEARYTAGRTEFFTPARLGPEETSAAIAAALACHKVLGLRHLSRADLIVDEQGLPWVLEVNVAPGMTETSLLPQSVAASGEDAGLLYRAVLDVAIADHRRR